MIMIGSIAQLSAIQAHPLRGHNFLFHLLASCLSFLIHFLISHTFGCFDFTFEHEHEIPGHADKMRLLAFRLGRSRPPPHKPYQPPP